VGGTDTGRRVRGVGYVARELGFSQLVAGVGLRYRVEERLRVGVFRVVVEVGGRAALDQFSEVHHRHAVAQLLDDAHVVTDEQDGEVERFAQLFYLGYGIPNYWLAMVALMTDLPAVADRVLGSGTFTPIVLPAAILGTSLLAGQLRYARAESREYVDTAFLKLVRAKGASKWVTKHVLRNASLPLVSLFFADMLGILVVEMLVLEQIFHIRGIGNVGLFAIEQRDLPLVLGVAMVFAIAGIVGNLIQDLAYLVLDPRVEEG